MATTTNRVNGSVGTEDGGIYSPGASLAFYKITVKDASATAVDLRPESEINEAIELVVRTVPSIVAYDIVNLATGIIYVITDGANAWPAALLQTAIRGLGTSIGNDSIDVSGTVVDAGLGFTVSSTPV
jgi:hypothetical protein